MSESIAGEDLVQLWRTFSSTWKTWYKKAEENISVLDISIPEYRMMTYLVENGPSPMAKLASSTSVSQGWITSIVDRLEQQGLVRRIRSEEDRRIINIDIMEDGLKTIQKAREMHLDFVRVSFRNFSAEERELFMSLLLKLSDSLLETESSKA